MVLGFLLRSPRRRPVATGFPTPAFGRTCAAFCSSCSCSFSCRSLLQQEIPETSVVIGPKPRYGCMAFFPIAGLSLALHAVETWKPSRQEELVIGAETSAESFLELPDIKGSGHAPMTHKKVLRTCRHLLVADANRYFWHFYKK